MDLFRKNPISLARFFQKGMSLNTGGVVQRGEPQSVEGAKHGGLELTATT